jgi:hypothetical protein
MSHPERDPLDELRHADPVRGAPVPSISRARVWARIEEARMTTTTPPRRRLAPWAAGIAAVAVTGAIAMLTMPGIGEGFTPTPSQRGPGIGTCVETYSQETLANRDFAFDGTVTAIDGDEVTFGVADVFRGELAGSATFTATGMTGTSVTSAGGPSLVIGQRYLVAGDDRFAWACGFTRPYDAAVAAEWAEATR